MYVDLYLFRVALYMAVACALMTLDLIIKTLDALRKLRLHMLDAFGLFHATLTAPIVSD